MAGNRSGVGKKRITHLALVAVLIVLLLVALKLANFVRPQVLSKEELSPTHSFTRPVHTKALAIIATHVALESPPNEAQSRPTPQRVRVSPAVMAEYVKKRVAPRCPGEGSRLRGHVILDALINKKGQVENLRLVSGHPMLAYSAMEAVKDWRYRPHLLDNQPVEVETTVDVAFSCGSLWK